MNTAFNETDINEVVLRGGFERFKGDGTTEYRKAPWWEGIYGQSHFFRMIIHFIGFDGYFIHSSDLKTMKKQASLTIKKALENMVKYKEMNNYNFKIILLTHPFEKDIMDGNYNTIDFDFLNSIEGVKYIDMLPIFLEDGRINKETYQNYYWPIDKHHNSNGYWIFGELLSKKLVLD